MSTNKRSQSKWHEIKHQLEAPANTPLDNAAKIKKLLLNTQLGSPVDTVGEIDAQGINLGPNDTKLEAENTQEETKSFKI